MTYMITPPQPPTNTACNDSNVSVVSQVLTLSRLSLAEAGATAAKAGEGDQDIAGGAEGQVGRRHAGRQQERQRRIPHRPPVQDLRQLGWRWRRRGRHRPRHRHGRSEAEGRGHPEVSDSQGCKRVNCDVLDLFTKLLKMFQILSQKWNGTIP